MTLRKRAQLLVAITIGAFALLIFCSWAFDLSMYPAMAFCIVATVPFVMLRCPNCGKPILWNKVLWKRGWTMNIPRNCSRCGSSLEVESKSRRE
jgi:endogenous inhibitor of DNA gyrase (YacG/DUF329 family)